MHIHPFKAAVVSFLLCATAHAEHNPVAHPPRSATPDVDRSFAVIIKVHQASIGGAMGKSTNAGDRLACARTGMV
jgi:hypothetical protein